MPSPSIETLPQAVAIAANQSESLGEALRAALEAVCTATGWPLGHACALSPAAADFWQGAEGEAYAAVRTLTGPDAAPASTLPGRVRFTARPAWIADLTRSSADSRAPVLLAAGLHFAFALPVLADGGVAAVLEFFASASPAPDPHLLRLLGQVGRQLGRVAERQARQSRLEHDASHDPLTGLANRTLFLHCLSRALARGRRSARSGYAVLMLDLDRFHLVNDSLGHGAGDQLLLLVAERLAHALRSSDLIARGGPSAGDVGTLARLSGDEFTVLLEDLASERDALRVAARLQECLAPPLTLAGRQFYVTASIGIACGTDESDAAHVLRDADLAMNRAKALGGARAELFDQALHAAALTRMHLETDLRQGLSQQQFLLHYQPIVSLGDGSVTGVEALVRWRRDGRELLYPADFIAAAEDTGLILPLGLWVLREACLAARLWRRELQHPFTLGVNLSARQFTQPDLSAQVEHILADTGMEPAALRLEITESALLGGRGGNGLEQASSTLAQLKSLGVQIGIDDFGTGYSALSYLQHFPLDLVKIDRSFVAQLGGERDSQAIIKTILDLARNLNLQAVAEGVETEAQAALLLALGCPLAQGYYFARPMDAAHLRNYLVRAA